jgi:hypothetical protein
VKLAPHEQPRDPRRIASEDEERNDMSIKQAWLWLGLALAAAGCGSDAGTICDKLVDECHALNNVSVDDCKEEIEKTGTDSTRSDCADCLDSKSCATIAAGGCSTDCTALFSGIGGN